jgi:hypothetical protein
MVEPELVEAKPCSCGAQVLRFRFPDTSDEYWRCENAGQSCHAFGNTYETALEAASAPAPDEPGVSEANKARLLEMLDTRVDEVADAATYGLMTEAFNDCVNGLAACKTDEGKFHVLGHTLKVAFMLGRLSASH